MVICDGMIVGSGIIILRRVSSSIVQIPTLILNLSVFYLLAKVPNQHNMGKVYSGLYQCQCAGHVALYLVLVTFGKPMEPGNCGIDEITPFSANHPFESSWIPDTGPACTLSTSRSLSGTQPLISTYSQN